MSIETSSKQSGAQTLDSEGIYERIVSAVLNHQLPPGTKLGEERLALAFGVSRSRIRPALARLALEQVVTLSPNRGATVAEPSEQEAREVFEVRRIIEPTLVQRFMTFSRKADIDVLRHCLDAQEAARDAGDSQQAIRLAGNFHLEIADRAQHSTLARVLHELTSRTSLILMTYSATQLTERDEATACGCREHRVLLDAIRVGDPKVAARVMQEHLLRLEGQLRFSTSNGNGPDLMQLFGRRVQ